QAEDGIRDRNVTGVQTCALPISRRASPVRSTSSTTASPRATAPPRKGPPPTATPAARQDAASAPAWAARRAVWVEAVAPLSATRSEERRGGKEGGAGGGAGWRKR